jgi:MATE family multidrug resistance protein
MNVKSELKSTLILATPIVISQVGQLAYGLMDSAMVGRLGAVPLSASAFVNNIFNIPFIFLAGVTSAVSVLISRQYGAKNYKKIGDILWVSSVVIGALCLALILALQFLGGHLHIFSQPKATQRSIRSISWLLQRNYLVYFTFCFIFYTQALFRSRISSNLTHKSSSCRTRT